MNKIELLEQRRAEILSETRELREKIAEIIDEKSFVELGGYSFSKNDFYGEEKPGNGVVTGYAAIDGNPVYLIAQNANENFGGVTLSNCKKIAACITRASETATPVIYLLNSYGVEVGEGVNVLEGIAEVLSASAEIKGFVPQISIVLGRVYGSMSLLAAACDACYVVKGGEICYDSPLVLAASEKHATAQKVAGYENSVKSGLVTSEIENLSEAKEKILSVISCEDEIADDYNRTAEELDEKTTVSGIISAAFDGGKFEEINSAFVPEIKVGYGAIGKERVAAIIFGDEENGVSLGLNEVIKIKQFVSAVAAKDLPLVTFVNTLGIKREASVSASPVLKEISELISEFKNCRRISVVYGNAIGLGYTLFAAKSLGVKYLYAFANAKIALFSGDRSAVAFGKIREDKFEEFERRYSEENADPINAARNGYVDDIIRPSFVRPYLVSALKTL